MRECIVMGAWMRKMAGFLDGGSFYTSCRRKGKASAKRFCLSAISSRFIDLHLPKYKVVSSMMMLNAKTEFARDEIIRRIHLSDMGHANPIRF